MTTDYDAIIVGARVAGSITATLLGEYGYKVLLLDRARFPSDTLSTHFFRYPALQSFQRMGVFDQVQSVAPHLVDMFNDIEGHTWSEPVVGKDGIDYFMCIRRITLDSILTERVKQEPNVTFLQGARFNDLMWDAESVVGVEWSDEAGRHQATARVVIGADGFYSQVAKLVEPETEEFEPVHRAMYYSYFKDIVPLETSSAEFYFQGDRLVYVFPTDDNLTLVAVSVPIAEFDAYRKDAEGEMMKFLNGIPSLAPRLQPAEMAAPIKGAGNIPCYLRVPYGDGWALVGDAGLVFDPWSGQGIDHASQHAVMLADALHEYFQNKKTWAEAMSAYHALRNKSSKKNFQRTRTVARDIRVMSAAALKTRGIS
ncbi:MAG TPA: NAD(P)/FAD-dependent oxidoreductase [Anaerolineales bacterium]|nr:NAD(P)/FAD-dependent oxidoreductase [Anaerolineales bacterium]